MYTIDNPKTVNYWNDPEEENFTGVVKNKNSDIAYYVNSKLHREDGPARIFVDGTIEYFLNGKCHREDGPAIIYPNRSKSYWLNGKRHK